eukprot:Skav201466  [mRNA]  locus=scaffold663:53443:59592:+ [translate_table: standard]
MVRWDGLKAFLLIAQFALGQRVSLERRLKEAKERGLSGYDLIDAMDVWYGSNSPDFRGPHNQLDFIGNRDGRVTLEDWRAAGLPTEHFHYFDSNQDGVMSVDEAHSWHQQKKPARTMNLSEVDSPPVGHLKPMGGWKAPLSSEGLEYRKPYPHPREFWRKHMDGYLPANLKGAQHGWPAMNWTRDELIKRFGWVEAKLEPKVEGRGNDTAYADLDKIARSHRLNVSEFKYDSDLQWSRGRKFKPRDPLNNKWTDWVYLDPDRVDLIVQHKLRNMDYYELIQEAGDCIFIPFAMLHQVHKLDDGLQVAASWMFLPETIYEEDVCKEAPLQEDLPLAAMDTLFMYSGKGLIPQGYQDPLNFVNKLLQYMDDSNEEHLSLETFTRTVTEGDAILRRIRNNKRKIKNLYKRIVAYGKTSGQLARSELRKVPLRLWAKPAAEGDEEGPFRLEHVDADGEDGDGEDAEDGEDGEGGSVDEVDEVAHVDPYELADSDDGDLFAALEKAAQESGDPQDQEDEIAGSQESPEAVAEPTQEKATPDLGTGETQTAALANA